MRINDFGKRNVCYINLITEGESQLADCLFCEWALILVSVYAVTGRIRNGKWINTTITIQEWSDCFNYFVTRIQDVISNEFPNGFSFNI